MQAIHRFLDARLFSASAPAIQCQKQANLSGDWHAIDASSATVTSTGVGVRVRSVQTRAIEDDRARPHGWVNALVVELVKII